MPPTEAELTRLHADHAGSVFRLAWSITKDMSLAEDVMQEVFLKLARGATVVAGARSEKAVLLTIARNLSIDLLRRHRSRQNIAEQWSQDLPEWFEPAADAEAAERQILITEALATLPEGQRTAIHLHVWEEMSFREIGEIEGLPTQTIASRFRYGMEKLRAALGTIEELMP